MSWRYYYRNRDGDIVEFTDRVQEGWADKPGTTGLVMNAETGTTGISSLRVEDPDGDWDIDGHRLVMVIEDELEYDDYGGAVWIGYSTDQIIERDIMRTDDARIWTIGLTDLNSIFERRLMEGAENNRPAETDVERIAWLLTTNEAALIDDDLYFSTDQPFNMDAVDYRGQSFRNIWDDCSLQSGKNWFLWRNGTEFSAWYQPRGGTDFSSDIKISNVLADQDGATVFAPALATRLRRDPSRVYSGVHLSYDGSYVYVQFDSTAEQFARRDAFSSALNVKTKAQAVIRANRYLSDIATQELVITTAIIVPRLQTNDVVAGQRIQVKYSHFPGFTDYVWMRVLNRTVRELGLDEIELALTLSPDEPVDTSIPELGAVYGTLMRAKGYAAWPYVWFETTGDNPKPGDPTRPTVGLIEALNDPDGPLAPSWDYYGWKITGTGTVDVKFYTSTTAVSFTPVEVYWRILLNGVVVAEYHEPLAGTGADGEVTVTGLAVVPDDVISAQITSDPLGVAFFQAPRGTGNGEESLTITGGSLF